MTIAPPFGNGTPSAGGCCVIPSTNKVVTPRGPLAARLGDAGLCRAMPPLPLRHNSCGRSWRGPQAGGCKAKALAKAAASPIARIPRNGCARCAGAGRRRRRHRHRRRRPGGCGRNGARVVRGGREARNWTSMTLRGASGETFQAPRRGVRGLECSVAEREPELAARG